MTHGYDWQDLLWDDDDFDASAPAYIQALHDKIARLLDPRP